MLTPKQKKLIEELAADVKPLVDDIESRPETTQNHYGDYGGALSRLSKGDKGLANVFAVAMMKAGGNKIGIQNGLKHFV